MSSGFSNLLPRYYFFKKSVIISFFLCLILYIFTFFFFSSFISLIRGLFIFPDPLKNSILDLLSSGFY